MHAVVAGIRLLCIGIRKYLKLSRQEYYVVDNFKIEILFIHISFVSFFLLLIDNGFDETWFIHTKFWAGNELLFLIVFIFKNCFW